MMHIQANCNTVVGNFRPNRKRFPFNGSLYFLLVLIFCCIVQQAAARPSQDEDLSGHFDGGDKLRNVDNLETHRRDRVVDIVSQEDHPVIIYKEDFVSEDYVPLKNESKSEKHKRRYKDIVHRRRHNRQNITDVVIEDKPEKILFDIIPDKPIIVLEDMEKSKKSHMKLVPLTDDFVEVNAADNEGNALKEELNKRPKKFHHRVRRSASEEHIVRKRNPYFRHIPKVAGEAAPTQVQYIYVKHSVPGKKHNGLDIPIVGPRPRPSVGPTTGDVPISFETRVAVDENDRVIFSGGRTTARPAQRVTESIFRDPRPENFDFSFMNSQRQTTTRRSPSLTTRRPQTLRQEESIFRDPRPENFDFSFMNPQQEQSALAPARVSTPVSVLQPTTQAGISQCVWGIINCCSRSSSDIRYACFEENGCDSAFWDLNPCADNVRDNIVNFVAKYYN